MKSVKIGISAHRGMSSSTLEKADYIEIKKITEEEVVFFRRLTEKPVLFHIQYSDNNSYYRPAASDLKDHLAGIASAYDKAQPRLTSLHFGLSARSMSIDTESYLAVDKHDSSLQRPMVSDDPFDSTRLLLRVDADSRLACRRFHGTIVHFTNCQLCCGGFQATLVITMCTI